MTYQRNMTESLLPQEDVLDDALEDEIGRIEEDADDHTGDQHDRDTLDQLVLARPLDLFQLAPRLGDEAAQATARDVSLSGAAVARGHCSRSARRRSLRRPRALGLRAVAHGLGPSGTPLSSRLAGH